MLIIFRRIWNIFRGKSHTVLNKLEKPEEQLSVFIEDLNKSIIKLQQSVASAVADEKKLKLEVEKAVTSVNSWEQKAMLALKQGDESLAREALLRKEEEEDKAKSLHQSWKNQKQAADQFKENLWQAKRKVEEAKIQYKTQLTRYRTAQAQEKITETITHGHGNSPLQLFEQLNEKIVDLEAKSEANLELMEENMNNDLESKFAMLEKASRGDQALVALKAKVQSEIPVEVLAVNAKTENSPEPLKMNQ